MKLSCRIGWHNWTQWEITHRNMEIEGAFTGRSFADLQRRKCSHCNRSQLRIARAGVESR